MNSMSMKLTRLSDYLTVGFDRMDLSLPTDGNYSCLSKDLAVLVLHQAVDAAVVPSVDTLLTGHCNDRNLPSDPNDCTDIASTETITINKL